MNRIVITCRFPIRLAAIVAIALFVMAVTACEKKPAQVTPLPANSVKILFLGDTSFGENYGGTPKVLKKNGYTFPLEKVAPLLNDATFTIANLETPITDIEESPFKDSKAWCHWTHVEHAPRTLKQFGIRTVGLANNHTLDFGMPGLEQTLKIIKDNQMVAFGAGLNEIDACQPFFKTFEVGANKQKIAVIAGFEYSSRYENKYDFFAKGDKGGACRLSRDKIGQQIKRIKGEDPSTFVVIYPHWGKNYAWKKSKQTNYAHRFIDDGADLVIGHGGHAMQEIERYKDKWIVYGLGNFMFLSPGRYKAKKCPPFSYGAELILAKDSKGVQKRVRLYPIHTNNRKNNYQTRLLTDTEFQQFHQLLMEKSPLTESAAGKVALGKDTVGHFVEFMLD